MSSNALNMLRIMVLQVPVGDSTEIIMCDSIQTYFPKYESNQLTNHLVYRSNDSIQLMIQFSFEWFNSWFNQLRDEMIQFNSRIKRALYISTLGWQLFGPKKYFSKKLKNAVDFLVPFSLKALPAKFQLDKIMLRRASSHLKFTIAHPCYFPIYTFLPSN